MESLGFTMGFTSASASSYGNSSGPKTVAEANLKLLENRKFCDVAFHVGPYKEKIECHQLILMNRSKVFESMFRDNWDSAAATRSVVVDIPDVEPRAFKLFLQFVYGDKSEMSVSKALHVLYVAHKYQVDPLVETCSLLLKQEFDIKDVVQVYESAARYFLTDLEKDALEFMAMNFGALAGSYYFFAMGKDTLISVLKRDDLTMEEVKIFEHVLEWADSQKYKDTVNGEPRSSKEILGPILPYIRFPLMPSKDFAAKVVPTSLLSQEDVVALFVYYNAQGNARNELGQNLRYSCQPRLFWTPTNAVVEFYEPDHNMVHPDLLDTVKYVNSHEDILEFLFISEAPELFSVPKPHRLPAITSVVLNGPNFSSFVSHPAYIARDVQLPTCWKITLTIEKTVLPDYFGEVIGDTGSSFFTKANVDIYAYMDVEVEINPPIFLEHNSRYKISVLYQSLIGVLPCEMTGWRHDVCTSRRIVQDFKVRHDRGVFTFRPMGPYEQPNKSFDKTDVLKSHSIRSIKVSDS